MILAKPQRLPFIVRIKSKLVFPVRRRTASRLTNRVATPAVAPANVVLAIARAANDEVDDAELLSIKNTDPTLNAYLFEQYGS